MALPTTLNTNEVKNSAGTEVEFNRLGPGVGRSVVFAQNGEAPYAPRRLTISHVETGVGVLRRRRGLIRFDYSTTGQYDSTKIERISAYTVLDSPIGNLTANDIPTHVLAYLNSFMASLGASTTILYDGTGNGTQALLTGGL
jgi:hypothetical protein